MAARCPYVTEHRCTRDRAYVLRMRWAALGALVVHLVLVAAFAPFKQQIPLVRHIGHEGPLRLLPEISVVRDVGEIETEEERARGLGARSFLKVIDTRLVVDDVVPEDEPHIETGDYEQDFGDELLHLLEQSLPQPTSRDVVLVKFVKPAYPALSIAEGTQGVVEFRVHVTSRGRVARAWLLSSEVDERMESAARRALLQWRFRPHVSNGVSVDFLVDQRVRFRLNEVVGSTGVGTGIR